MLNNTERAASCLKRGELQAPSRLTINHLISTIQAANVIQDTFSSTANKQNALISNFRISSLVKDWIQSGFKSFASGTATSATGTTLVNSAKTWATNQWANSQIRIVSGLGAGQIRTIASNTGTVITTSAAWTTNPDATSVYSIEGNDDFIYYTGSGGTAFYRYSISGGTWTAMATLRQAARSRSPTRAASSTPTATATACRRLVSRSSTVPAPAW